FLVVAQLVREAFRLLGFVHRPAPLSKYRESSGTYAERIAATGGAIILPFQGGSTQKKVGFFLPLEGLSTFLVFREVSRHGRFSEIARARMVRTGFRKLCSWGSIHETMAWSRGGPCPAAQRHGPDAGGHGLDQGRARAGFSLSTFADGFAGP